MLFSDEPGKVARVPQTAVKLAGRMSGCDVTDALRFATPGLALVYASPTPPDEARLAAGSSFFAKPYDTADVVTLADELAPDRDRKEH